MPIQQVPNAVTTAICLLPAQLGLTSNPATTEKGKRRGKFFRIKYQKNDTNLGDRMSEMRNGWKVAGDEVGDQWIEIPKISRILTTTSSY